MSLVATTEGIVLDPIYTGRALAGLIAAVDDGDITPGSTTVYMHTGGLPGLFGHPVTVSYAGRHPFNRCGNRAGRHRLREDHAATACERTRSPRHDHLRSQTPINGRSIEEGRELELRAANESINYMRSVPNVGLKQ
jgi:hypothetical protein